MAGKYDLVKLAANKSINEAFGGMFSGITKSVEYAVNGKTIAGAGRSLKTGASAAVKSNKKLGLVDSVLEAHKGAPGAIDTIGGYSGRKIAGSYIGVSAAGRVASGGGVYKDSSGNTDVIGIPLI